MLSKLIMFYKLGTPSKPWTILGYPVAQCPGGPGAFPSFASGKIFQGWCDDAKMSFDEENSVTTKYKMLLVNIEN